ncbi:hypothetical protein KAR91_44105 [Candidatus Pacearchaeota archaeon]|nr:hypothetical protein [Candidatus Pacearchaeota archaeon]
MNKTDALMDKIDKLSAERDATFRKLRRSLAIESLWSNPTWPVRSYIAGSHSKGFKFYIKDSNKEIRIFDINEIPGILKGGNHQTEVIKN